MITVQRIVLSETEEQWTLAMQTACNRCFPAKNKSRAANENSLDAMTEALFNDPQLRLHYPPPSFRPRTRIDEDGLPIRFYFWGQTENELLAALGYYRKGKYWPHAHGPAKVLFFSGRGRGFHLNEKLPDQPRWFDIKAGAVIDHPDGIFHGYDITGDSLVLALGARPATGNTRPASKSTLRLFKKGPPAGVD